MRQLLALALLLAPVAAESTFDPDPTDALTAAREDLRLWRSDFRKLARVEREAIVEARATVAASAKGRALAPAFAAAAEALEGVRGQDKGLSDLLGEMARSYRAMAAELEKEIAPEMAARAETLLKDAAEEKDADDAKRAWRIVRRGDPRYRALACNMKATGETLASLGEHEGALGEALAKVARLNAALAPMFAGVETARPELPAASCPT